ncbi:hypothetical protein COO55_20985 [Rhodococcus opacus]|nr:hypothetical protein Rwratislav_03554 [Rhodococcus wratislaviensis IFP 2016]RKM74271.1 hypothetical protein COO55_20985 [Rhodococcus opacus]
MTLVINMFRPITSSEPMLVLRATYSGFALSVRCITLTINVYSLAVKRFAEINSQLAPLLEKPGRVATGLDNPL